MSAIERNNGVKNETEVTIEMLKSVTGYRNCTSEELCRIDESLKELCLLLHLLSKDGVDQSPGS